MLSRVYQVLLQCVSPVLLTCVSGAFQVLPRCCRVRLSNHRLEPGRPGLQGLTLRLTCGALAVAYAAWHPQRVVAPWAAARRRRMLARCGRACVAFKAQLKHAARYSSTVGARQRSCQQNARPLQSALLPLVEVVVGLAAARGVGNRCRPAVPCPVEPAAPARAAAKCTCQSTGAQMCSGRACAVQWKCVLECAPWACARACSRARVRVCCARAAERAYAREKRPSRSRAAQLPDLRLAREGICHGGPFTEVFDNCKD